MADIAFLLLIFFLVTTTMDMDKGLDLVLPPVGETKEIPKKNIANLLVDAKGNVLLNKKPIKINDVKKEVMRMIAENDKLIISVKTHPSTKYQAYIDVLDQLKMANAKKISIAETEK
ncbi:MAG TPA: biopolymer transporter ExbD [Candidatus Marinimicrobia bacterium]|jgi:biopolymer transport protein ExbD|nr:biopolymer transporter ExbD [Candidatus Neomarinimicrobiota bacterium]HIC51321.1 biopolymer transporter ExbD [Candidatus Neomarinimicrobiota bacterium]HIM83479.1 biopolymer transporter ExbD [Candidatus Neomarinimicrobiota bacterium]HIO67960.1 biopolymer transporter ExbD [Flavobacteriales bacterium]